MKIHPNIRTYGDLTYRGPCPKEVVEQATFFNRIRKTPYGLVALHIRNEGRKAYAQVQKEKTEGGMVAGASDIVIPGSPAFVCELKRKDHTKSSWQTGQQEYLLAAQELGAFACLAFGVDAAWEAFLEWSAKR